MFNISFYGIWSGGANIPLACSGVRQCNFVIFDENRFWIAIEVRERGLRFGFSGFRGAVLGEVREQSAGEI